MCVHGDGVVEHMHGDGVVEHAETFSSLLSCHVEDTWLKVATTVPEDPRGSSGAVLAVSTQVIRTHSMGVGAITNLITGIHQAYYHSCGLCLTSCHTRCSIEERSFGPQ